MSLAIKDFVETEDLYLAAFACFLGYKIVRCVTPLSGPATFGLLVPANDWEIVNQEWADPLTTIQNPKKYAHSCTVCHSLIRKSKQNGGVYGESLVTRT